MTPDFFARNRSRLMARMEPDSIAILHSNDVMPRSADGTLGFSQNSSLFYLTGIAQEETVLILHPSAERPEDRERLFVRETSDLIRVWEGDKLTREQASAVSGVSNAQWLDQFRPALRRLARCVKRIYLEANEHPRATREVETRSERFRQECQVLYPGHEYARLAPFLYQLREIKQPEELEQIQTACNITAEGFQRVLCFVRPGVHEFEVEAEFLHDKPSIVAPNLDETFLCTARHLENCRNAPHVGREFAQLYSKGAPIHYCRFQRAGPYQD